MAHTIEGDGLFQLNEALKILVEQPEKLKDDRLRFYNLALEFNARDTTRLGTPYSPDIEEVGPEDPHLIAKFYIISEERAASYPSQQFKAQTSYMASKIRDAIKDGKLVLPAGISSREYTKECMRKEWIKQGIWNENWGSKPGDRWKHEEPAEIEMKVENKADFDNKPNTSRTEIPERSIVESMERKFERDASRPFHQFIYHLGKAREEIESEIKAGDDDVNVPNDIGTMAYERVKNQWAENSIWDTNWGMFPGMSWKHERPIEEFLDDDVIAAAKASILLQDVKWQSAPKSPAKIDCQVSNSDTDQKETDLNVGVPEQEHGTSKCESSPPRLISHEKKRTSTHHATPLQSNEEIQIWCSQGANTPAPEGFSTQSLPNPLNDQTQRLGSANGIKSGHPMFRTKLNVLGESLRANSLPRQQEIRCAISKDTDIESKENELPRIFNKVFLGGGGFSKYSFLSRSPVLGPQEFLYGVTSSADLQYSNVV
ncbi:uncharacterized protein F4822DRAFT_397419 [Hypoxylon trugodes]|uniref:uncharacterized protein n=1 Tax=Hypoxylon trugodes TaxID=326681 RepID=UPI00219FF59B|nr:uncharacterized protein F4822DRAFT_397419 [Hypoxylon trugodes]KAI1391665.1 hypothetical protein F4822DRAFT_397419 [Hypoxylon trugodes]